MSQLLLLEDDAVLGRGLKTVLESRGFNVLWAADLRSAEEITAQASIDLFILDWNLPDGSGLDFCKKIRARNSSVPVLFLTALSDEETALKAFAEGANDYVRKPFGQEELIARIQRALQEGKLREERFQYGELVLLMKSRRVFFGDQEINFNRREFDLLKILLKRAGNVVSRNELIEQSGQESEISDRTIDSHISHIRKRLKDSGINSLKISPSYGVGYRLDFEKAS